MKKVCYIVFSLLLIFLFWGLMGVKYGPKSIAKYDAMCEMILVRGVRTSSRTEEWWKSEILNLKTNYANASFVTRRQMVMSLEESLSRKNYQGAALKNLRPIDLLQNDAFGQLRADILDCKIKLTAHTNDQDLCKQWKSVEQALMNVDAPIQQLIIETKKMKDAFLLHEMMDKDLHL